MADASIHENSQKLFEQKPSGAAMPSKTPPMPTTQAKYAAPIQAARFKKKLPAKMARIVSAQKKGNSLRSKQQNRDELECDPDNRSGYQYRREHQNDCAVSSTGQSAE